MHVQQKCTLHDTQNICGQPPFFSMGTAHLALGQRRVERTIWSSDARAVRSRQSSSILHDIGAWPSPPQLTQTSWPHAHITGRSCRGGERQASVSATWRGVWRRAYPRKLVLVRVACQKEEAITVVIGTHCGAAGTRDGARAKVMAQILRDVGKARFNRGILCRGISA